MALKGLIAAPHTPMCADLNVNLNRIDDQAQLLIRNNVSGVYICGSTGEGMSLTIDERVAVATRWQQVARKDIKVVVNVGHTSINDCKALAVHAAMAGVYAISAMPPCYYKPATIGDLVEFYAQIASAAPNVPFYAYHTPGLTGVNFKMIQFLEIAAKKIPSLAGIKYNHNDFMDYAQCRSFGNGKYDILFGVDEMLLASLPYGTAGAIGSTYNYAAPLYHDLIKAFVANDYPRAIALQEKSIEVVNILIKFGPFATGKSIMRLVGVDCGPVRTPLQNLTSHQMDQLTSDLEDIGFSKFCSK
jgi:N-acetylneuraminate lyase